jgi:hypothetical protein
MIVDEEDFDALVEAVDNSQVRLANTFMVKVLAQLLDTVEEMHAKVEQMYEFLSSDEEETNTTKEDTVVAEEAPLAKPSAKTKQAPKVSEENTTELES